MVEFCRVRRQSLGSLQHASRGIVAPYIALSPYGSLDEFLDTHVRSAVRQDARRQIRRLMKQGNLSMVVYSEKAAALKAFQAFLDTYDRQWATADRPHMFSRQPNREYYRCVLESLLPSGWLHFSSLNLDSKPIAWHFGFIYNSRFWYIKPAYDVEWQSYSPGTVLLLRLIEASIQRGLSYFDFTWGNESYKRHYATAQDCVYRRTWYPGTLRGGACRAWDMVLRPKLRELKRRVLRRPLPPSAQAEAIPK
jgi:CelD/BcsL family acetyltransferase involved in cellulose biosynthesis